MLCLLGSLGVQTRMRAVIFRHGKKIHSLTRGQHVLPFYPSIITRAYRDRNKIAICYVTSNATYIVYLTIVIILVICAVQISILILLFYHTMRER